MYQQYSRDHSGLETAFSIWRTVVRYRPTLTPCNAQQQQLGAAQLTAHRSPLTADQHLLRYGTGTVLLTQALQPGLDAARRSKAPATTPAGRLSCPATYLRDSGHLQA